MADQTIPIIAVTALASPDYEKRGFEADAMPLSQNRLFSGKFRGHPNGFILHIRPDADNFTSISHSKPFLVGPTYPSEASGSSLFAPTHRDPDPFTEAVSPDGQQPSVTNTSSRRHPSDEAVPSGVEPFTLPFPRGRIEVECKMSLPDARTLGAPGERYAIGVSTSVTSACTGHSNFEGSPVDNTDPRRPARSHGERRRPELSKFDKATPSRVEPFPHTPDRWI